MTDEQRKRSVAEDMRTADNVAWAVIHSQRLSGVDAVPYFVKRASVRHDAQAGVYVATSQELDTRSQGETEEEARLALESAIRMKMKHKWPHLAREIEAFAEARAAR